MEEAENSITKDASGDGILVGDRKLSDDSDSTNDRNSTDDQSPTDTENCTVKDFAEELKREARELLDQYQDMKFTKQDLPQSFEIVFSLKECYRKARYDISEECCRALCDYLNEQHWATYIRDANYNLFKAFPEVFKGSSDPEEVST